MGGLSAPLAASSQAAAPAHARRRGPRSRRSGRGPQGAPPSDGHRRDQARAGRPPAGVLGGRGGRGPPPPPPPRDPPQRPCAASPRERKRTRRRRLGPLRRPGETPPPPFL